MKRFHEALSSYDKALVLNRNFAGAYNNRGNALQELKRFEEAVASYDKAIVLRPDYVVTYNNRGNALKELKRFEDALANYDKAIALKPDYAEAYNNRGAALREAQRFNEALSSYDKAVSLKPDYAEAHNNRGNALKELKRFDEALLSYDKAISLKPDYVVAYNNRGNALQELRRFQEALASYDQAIALKPDYAEAHYSRGSALSDLKLYDEALAMFGNALALKPDLAEAFLGRGKVFYELRRHDEASIAYEKALAIKPDLAEAWYGRGDVFNNLKRHEEAISAYDKALALKPDLVEVEGRRLYAKMHLCDWSNFDAECKHLIASVRKEILATPPFPLLAISASSDEQLSCAKLFNKRKYPPFDKPIWQGERCNHSRIRVAYLSADFHDHPVSYLLAGVFEQHDRKRFETIAISFGSNNPSEMLTRLQDSFDQFIDVKDQSDVDVAKLLKRLEVDIAVDLMGYTQDSRTEILALRSSPIQVNYLGYPGTMGTEYIDYIIGDRFVIPDMQRQHYSEKIIYLPDTFQANDSKRKIGTSIPCRDKVGLPENAFVFCSFNNSYKITPTWFDIWMRLLQQIDGSVLWLLAESSNVEHNLLKEAESRGINSARLVFAPRVSYSDYLARYQLADLFLDTFPFNAGTTASDALWAGLPLVTCSGEAFASRMAGSVLGAIGMSEMVTESMAAYEALACKLARNPDLMTSTRMKLARNRYHLSSIQYSIIHEAPRSGLYHDVRALSGWFSARSYYYFELNP